MFGEMAEWLKAAVLKTVISRKRDLEFESLSLRQIRKLVRGESLPLRQATLKCFRFELRLASLRVCNAKFRPKAILEKPDGYPAKSKVKTL